MRFVDKVVLAVLALAVIGAAARAIVMILMAIIVISFIVQPRETFGGLAGLMFLGLLGRFPVPMILLSTALVVFAIAEKRDL